MVKQKWTFALMLVATIVVAISASAFKISTDKVNDYLGIPGPVKFDGHNYLLTWSAHHSKNYYEQEYIPKGDSFAHFNSMMQINVIVGDLDVKDVAADQVKKIQERKKTDAIASYSITDHSAQGEYIVDFTLSESSNGKTTIVEWNGYRYKKFTDKTGRNGVVLFAISKRGYDGDAHNFLTNLKRTKAGLIKELTDYKIPAIAIKD